MKRINTKALNEFRNQIKEFENFATDPEWRWTLEYDMLINQELADDIINYIRKIDVNNLNYDNLEKVMLEVKQKSLDVKEAALKEEDIVKKWYLYRMSYAYYGLIEVIDEGSIITDKILDLFKNKYKDKYLDALKKVDNINPSILTNFSKESGNITSEEVNLYLLMKKWQDIEHLYHNNELIKPHNEAKDNFEKYVYENYPYLSEIKGRDLLGIYLLNKEAIIDYEDIFKFFDIGITDKLAYIIGGKNLGLAKLKYNGVEIPNACAISVDSLLSKRYLNEIDTLGNHTYSVRSSATVEDNKKQSFAGMFKTKLNVDLNSMSKAIEEVGESVNTDRVKEYSKKFKTKKPYMSVVIQDFKEPEYSGVWLGTTLDKGHLEWTRGNGEKLVSGKVIPTYENWNEEVKNPITIDGIVVGERCIELQKKLNTISDFEWCVVNGKLLFVQFRPVTVKFTNDLKNDKESANVVKGIPASSGITEGTPEYLEEVDEINNFKEGDILLSDFTDPDWVPAMIKSKGIVTAEGGFLSHSAIISRELGIPCVVGVGYDNIEKLSKYDSITVNGTNGTVKKLVKSKKSNLK